MPGETKHEIECTAFEALVSDALEGRLDAARRASFDAHRQSCEICGPLFAEVEAGQRWLRVLASEVIEPPPYLVHNILAATTGVVSTRPVAATAGGSTTPFSERLRERWDAFFTPVAAFVRQPRFVMSFGMIFFSFSLALSAAGVKPADLAKVDLRPMALRHAYNDAQIKVVQYYDNIRFVYEIESRVRELKRANTPVETAPETPKGNRKNNTSGQPDQRQDRNYSQENSQPVLAALRDAGAPITFLRDGVENAPPAVTGTTNRRFV
ncbi:MAG: zf-HC2 domain-containing protein [Terriglobales bacterium]